MKANRNLPATSLHRVLVTGFEPFEQDTVNPSWEVARALHGAVIEGAEGILAAGGSGHGPGEHENAA